VNSDVRSISDIKVYFERNKCLNNQKIKNKIEKEENKSEE